MAAPLSDAQIKALVRAGQERQKEWADNTVTHTGWNLTPEAITSAFLQAEMGNPTAQCDMIDDCAERDLTYGGLVESRTDALVGKFSIIQPGDSDSDSRYQADAFAEYWRALDTSALIGHHDQCVNQYGYGASEIDYQYDGRLIAPVQFWHSRARDFYIQTTYNRRHPDAMPDDLLLRRSLYDYQGEPLIPGKWIVTRRTTVVPLARAGLGRGSVWCSHIKMLSLGDWLIFVRRYGLPFVLARIQDWSSETERARGWEILQNLGDDGAAVVADNGGIKVEFLDGAQGSRNTVSDLHQRIASFCNSEMAKRWNGATLSSESGDGASSYALAKEHGGIRFELLQADAMRIEHAINTQLIEPWSRMNNLPGLPPRLKFHIVKITDPKAFADVAEIVVNKLKIDVSAEQILEAVGMRPARNGDSTGESQDTEDSNEQ